MKMHVFHFSLQVLTQNVGVLLNIDRQVETCIAEYLSSKQLTFEQFLYFLTHEVWYYLFIHLQKSKI